MWNFRRLVVWQRPHQLALDVHRTGDRTDPRHRFSLGDHLIRSAEGIPAHIAEGAGGESVREFRRLVIVAPGTAAELENHPLLATGPGIIGGDVAQVHLSEVAQMQRMLTCLRHRVPS